MISYAFIYILGWAPRPGAFRSSHRLSAIIITISNRHGHVNGQCVDGGCTSGDGDPGSNAIVTMTDATNIPMTINASINGSWIRMIKRKKGYDLNPMFTY